MSAAVTPPATSAGHPIGFWFIFWGEFAERCSYYGMRAILAKYMSDELGYGEANSGTYMAFFIAACYFLPLVGGYIADNFFGKYWTIVGFSLPYIVGQLLVGFPNQYMFFGSLVLLAMGSGVIKPNISTLMGLTYDQQRPGNDQLRNSAFSWFYVAINIGALLGQLGVPYVKDTYGYRAAFLVPAVFMALALAAFALGKRYYAVENVRQQNAAATVTAAEKWQFVLRVSGLFLPIMMFWAAFDQTASTWIFFGSTYMHPLAVGSYKISAEQLQFVNAFFIVTLTPVLRSFFASLAARGTTIQPITKLLIGFAFTAAACGILAAAGSMAGTTQTVTKLNFPEGDLIVPATDAKLDAWTGPVTAGGVVLTGDWKYDADKKKQGFTTGTVRLANGTELAVTGGHLVAPPDAAALTAGGVLEPLLKSADALAKVPTEPTAVKVEAVEWVPPVGRVTMWLMVLAYFVLTIGELLISATGLELAFVIAPPAMKGFVTALFLLMVWAGNLFVNAPITRLYPQMSPAAYFGMLAGLVLVAGAIYGLVSKRFKQAPPAKS